MDERSQQRRITVVYEGEPDSRRGLLVVAGVVLVLAAVIWGVANEESDIEARAGAALAAANVPGRVIVAGRDATVFGVERPEMRGAITAILRDVRGVRAIAFASEFDAPIAGTRLEDPAVPTATAAVPTSAPVATTAAVVARAKGPEHAHLTATLQQGNLSIRGLISSREVASSIEGVADLIYAPFVNSDLVVDENVAPAPWLEGAPGAIAVLPIVSSAMIRFDEHGAVLVAAAPDRARAAQLSLAVGTALGESVEVFPLISVTELEPPVFDVMTDAEGSVVVSGLVPGAEIADAIVDSLESAYGPGVVIADIEVREGIGETFSLYRLPVALPLFAPFTQWELHIVDDVITGTLRSGASFASGSATLTTELQALLDIAAGILVRNPTLAMQIEGHTDAVGSSESNLVLSVARAESARTYLVERGVDPGRLDALGHGEVRPIADNGSKEGRAQNRRVEFLLGPGGSGG